MSGQIRRRSKVVKLYQGGFEQELEELLENLTKAEESDRAAKRMASKGKARAAAAAYDAKVEEAEQDAVPVTVWAIGFREFSELSNQHEPREDEKKDEQFGVNMKTFPDDLALAALGNEPVDTRLTVEQMMDRGRSILDGLGDISQVHWVKIRNAAWAVNVGSDELPKFSAVSWLEQRRERSSTSLTDGESLLDD